MATLLELVSREDSITEQMNSIARSRTAFKAHGRAGKQAHCTRKIAALKRSRAAVRAWIERVG
jgi:hypothetical protein